MVVQKREWLAFQRKVAVRLDRKSKDLTDQARRALALSVIEGAIKLQDLLEEAETATGRDRANNKGNGVTGGTAGRHASGNMIASVSHNGDRLVRTGLVMGSFGWYAAQFEHYFYYQDAGTPTIPEANALHEATIYARERFRRRMDAIVQGKELAV